MNDDELDRAISDADPTRDVVVPGPPAWEPPRRYVNSDWRELLYGLMIGGTIVFVVWLMLR